MKDKTPSARGLSVLWWSIPIPSGSGLDISTVSASGFHLNVYRGRSLECSDITSPFKFNFLGKRFSLCRKKKRKWVSHISSILLFFSAGWKVISLLWSRHISNGNIFLIFTIFVFWRLSLYMFWVKYTLRV